MTARVAEVSPGCMRCADCGRSVPKRKSGLCSDCREIIADGLAMDAGTWVPNGRGVLVFVPGGDAA